jgi:hypothetical protein
MIHLNGYPSSTTMDVEITTELRRAITDMVLPLEMFEAVFYFLDFPSYAAISLVCRLFKLINNYRRYWSNRFNIAQERCKYLMKNHCLPRRDELLHLCKLYSGGATTNDRYILLTLILGMPLAFFHQFD